MKKSIFPRPKMNQRILELALEICEDALLATPEAEELQDLNNMIVGKLEGLVDADTLRQVENLYAKTEMLFATEMFKAGVALGCNPGFIFDLPNTQQ